MESNINERLTPPSETALAEPRFDEKATLLSAQPVVPLAAVAARARSTRWWTIASALALAGLIGFFVTSLFYAQQEGSVASSLEAVEGLVEGSPVKDVKTEDTKLQPSRAEPKMTPESEAKPEVKVDQSPASSRATSGRPVARRVGVLTYGRRSRSTESRDERRAAEREEQRRKREARSEERSDRSSDGSLRVREIFEGPHNP